MAKGEVKITFKVFNEEFKSRMQEMKESTTHLNREFRLQQEQMKLSGSESDKLKAQIGYLNDRYKQAQDRVKMTDEQLEKAKKTFGENSEEVKRLEGELILAKTAEQKFDNQLKETNQQLVEAESKTLKASESLKKLGDGMQDAGKKLADAGKKMTLGVTTPIIGMGTAAVKSSIDFESAFAGVRKTIDGSEGDFKRLETGIRNMAKEIPASATAIAEVAESAGQLGIETDNVLGFTRVMIDLGEATNLSANDASTAFARFANIVGMSQNDFDKLGSTVVELGNNLATTEAEIVNMGMRLAGAGKQIGLSEAQIMGFAGALSSVGIEAEAGKQNCPVAWKQAA